MSDAILDQIRQLLKQAGAEFREVQHEPTFTSEQAAEARGEELRIGGKALLLKTGDSFRLFVLSAERKVQSSAIRRHLKLKKTRFATAEELHELTGLVPGAVPPFGSPILPFELYVDSSILANPRIAFNAGSLTDSIVVSVEDYLRVAKPMVFEFTR